MKVFGLSHDYPIISPYFVLQVHLLNDESRGATMEAVVSRMKTIQRAMGRETTAAGGVTNKHGIRFIAVSATVPNAQDVGQI